MGKRQARAVWEYDSMAEFEADGGVLTYGVGRVVIQGVLYTSDGLNLFKSEKQTTLARNIPPSFIDIADVLANYSAVVTNGSLVSESPLYAKSASKSIMLNTNVGNPAGSAYIQGDNKSIALSADLSGTPTLFCFYAPFVWSSLASGLELWLSNGVGLSGANRSRADLGYRVNPGWNVVAIDKRTVGNDPFCPNWVANGAAGVNFADPIQSFRWKLFGDTVRYNPIYVDSFFEGYRERPKVVVTFDDNRTTGYTVGYLEARKRAIKTSMFTIFDLIGNAGYASLAQMRQMSGDPSCYVGLHGNVRFDGLGSGAGKDPRAEMLRNINGLKNLGLSDCLYMAWPEGAMYGENPDVALNVASSLGILGARSTFNSYQYFYKGAYNPLSIKAISLNISTSLAQAKLAIDTAIAWGCSVVFYAHKFGDIADSETWVTSDYIDLLDYIATKRSLGLIDDQKFDDFMRNAPSPVTGASI